LVLNKLRRTWDKPDYIVWPRRTLGMPRDRGVQRWAKPTDRVYGQKAFTGAKLAATEPARAGHCADIRERGSDQHDGKTTE
jgi:hypothetical protein